MQCNCPAKYKLASDWNAQISRWCASSTPAAALQERSQVELTECLESSRDFDYDNLETCSIFEHIQNILFKSPDQILYLEY